MQTDILSYDKYLVQFSGGKDSSAVFLYLLEEGVSLNKIELWHQDIDGLRGGFLRLENNPQLLSPVLPMLSECLSNLQGKEGGFQRELLQQECTPRPQPASNLRMVRWPAAVGNAVIPEPG